jgi:hypothetical protein
MIVLLSNKMINITENDVEKKGFFPIIEDSLVLADAEKGRRFFLKKYFWDTGGIKIGLNTMELRTIIDVLYNWRIQTFIDNENGLLQIYKSKWEKYASDSLSENDKITNIQDTKKCIKIQCK